MNILKTSVAVGLTFIIGWSWVSWAYLLLNVGVTYAALSMNFAFAMFGNVLLFSSCCLNAILYTVTLEPFKDGLRKFFKQMQEFKCLF